MCCGSLRLTEPYRVVPHSLRTEQKTQTKYHNLPEAIHTYTLTALWLVSLPVPSHITGMHWIELQSCRNTHTAAHHFVKERDSDF